jgi:hypothetical protein
MDDKKLYTTKEAKFKTDRDSVKIILKRMLAAIENDETFHKEKRRGLIDDLEFLQEKVKKLDFSAFEMWEEKDKEKSS